MNRTILQRAAFLALLLAPFLTYAQQAGSALQIPKDQLIQPEELSHELLAHPRDSPILLQVGSHMLFDEAHIPGSEYAGPAAQPEGLESLRKMVDSLPRSRAIVIYCGCCPWDRCPNIGPAWRTLHEMGFTHVRALYIAHNFGADWVAKGYRAEPSK